MEKVYCEKCEENKEQAINLGSVENPKWQKAPFETEKIGELGKIIKDYDGFTVLSKEISLYQCPNCKSVLIK